LLLPLLYAKVSDILLLLLLLLLAVTAMQLRRHQQLMTQQQAASCQRSRMPTLPLQMLTETC
jgi:hypothetical protein